MAINFYQQYVVSDLILREHYISYARDFLGSFSLPIVSLRGGDALQQIGHVEMRHDIDDNLENAVAMAQVEHRLNISATYFFLPPNGVEAKSNYFGYIHKNRVQISPIFVEEARRLQDMGHEVGLHNDFISLWIGTGLSPREQLEDIVTKLRKHGIAVSGTASHGSPLCRKYGYKNYEIFQDVFLLSAAPRENLEIIDVDGKILPLAEEKISMQEFGLTYEAYFRKRTLYITDSGNHPLIFRNGVRTPITAESLKNNCIAEELVSFTTQPIVQCLIHPEHWDIAITVHEKRFEKSFNDIEKEFLLKKLQTKFVAIEKHPSLVYGEIHDVDSMYNYNYNKNTFHFAQQAVWLKDVLPYVSKRSIASILEVGCGQGEFLALVAQNLPPDPQRAVVGMDGSYAAIADCVLKHPEYRWATDKGELFIDNLLNDAPCVKDIPKKYDLILDKTGLTAVQNFEAAYAVLKKLSHCLTEGGCYIYMASEEFYARRYGDREKWPMTWIEIARKIFAKTEVLSDSAAMVFAFSGKK